MTICQFHTFSDVHLCTPPVILGPHLHIPCAGRCPLLRSPMLPPPISAAARLCAAPASASAPAFTPTHAPPCTARVPRAAASRARTGLASLLRQSSPWIRPQFPAPRGRLCVGRPAAGPVRLFRVALAASASASRGCSASRRPPPAHRSPAGLLMPASAAATRARRATITFQVAAEDERRKRQRDKQKSGRDGHFVLISNQTF